MTVLSANLVAWSVCAGLAAPPPVDEVVVVPRHVIESEKAPGDFSRWENELLDVAFALDWNMLFCTRGWVSRDFASSRVLQVDLETGEQRRRAEDLGLVHATIPGPGRNGLVMPCDAFGVRGVFVVDDKDIRIGEVNFSPAHPGVGGPDAGLVSRARGELVVVTRTGEVCFVELPAGGVRTFLRLGDPALRGARRPIVRRSPSGARLFCAGPGAGQYAVVDARGAAIEWSGRATDLWDAVFAGEEEVLLLFGRSHPDRLEWFRKGAGAPGEPVSLPARRLHDAILVDEGTVALAGMGDRERVRGVFFHDTLAARPIGGRPDFAAYQMWPSADGRWLALAGERLTLHVWRLERKHPVKAAGADRP